MTSPKKSATPAVADKPMIWLLVVVVPFVVYFCLSYIGVARQTAIFLSIVSITLISWMFSLMADFIPALLALLLMLLFGLIPNKVALSGFSSDGFLIAFSVMGLGAVISASGLANRYTLWLLTVIPAHTFAFQIAVFFTGFLMNPVVPTITARAAITGPVLNNIAGHLNEPDLKKSANLLYVSGLDGINYLSPVFLTAAPANLMVFGLFPAQEQAAFQFMHWARAASITGVIMLVSYFFISFVYFRGYARVCIEKKEIEKQWRQRGKMTWQEGAALSGIVLLAVGIMTSAIHRIPISLVTFIIICFLMIVGALSREAFIREIDWAFLFLLAGMIGIMAGVHHMGMDEMLVSRFQGFGEFMRFDFNKFVLILAGITLAVRFFIPLNSAILILAAAMLPMAAGAGISPWVVGFIILIMSETAFFGYQSPYILFFRNLTGKHIPYAERKVQIFHGLLVLAKLGAIYASIPFWRLMGIL